MLHPEKKAGGAMLTPPAASRYEFRPWISSLEYDVRIGSDPAPLNVVIVERREGRTTEIAICIAMIPGIADRIRNDSGRFVEKIAHTFIEVVKNIVPKIAMNPKINAAGTAINPDTGCPAISKDIAP